MVVLDKSTQNFILQLPDLEEIETKLREEERKKTGRCLAITVVLLLIVLGLYHIVSHLASQASAWLSAAGIMFLYLLWLWYASQRRKQKQKKQDLRVEKEVTTVLQNLNNLRNPKIVNNNDSPQDNLIFSVDQEVPKVRSDNANTFNTNKVLKKHSSLEYSTNYEDQSLNDGEILIRTYSVG